MYRHRDASGPQIFTLERKIAMVRKSPAQPWRISLIVDTPRPSRMNWISSSSKDAGAVAGGDNHNRRLGEITSALCTNKIPSTAVGAGPGSSPLATKASAKQISAARLSTKYWARICIWV